MTKKEFVRNFKLFLISFVCCIPLFVLIGVLWRDNLGSFWTITIYVLIGAGAYVLALLIDKKRQEKLALKREKSRMERKYRSLEQARDVQNKDNKKDKNVKRK